MLLRVSLLLSLIFLLAWPAQADEPKPYKEGSVWGLTFIKVKPGMFDAYLREVLPVRKRTMEEAQKQGLVLSHKILVGEASNREDWDLLLMVEYKSWAAFDGLNDKFDAIAAKVVGSEERQVQMMIKRSDMREIVGDKTMQELVPK
ncbi:hypothetical protein [Chitinimonas sp.]|uniref:hypothetical protein n=1 Tax=Chitinimonas sp. TaxID=1934313 RepID=UPI002F95D55D